ncbi:hypothetical protein [Ectobacillus ponti]|uniref:Uncharacterized protein n=1 Tax=Ectobacillus ponti TaxID=2961894 RepID=A0AA41XCU5_9BACI|nr:hypothetical protein [Ectobacillus ponti]MCP8970560.1 hypothetical protein [Ectobacillus ponti]
MDSDKSKRRFILEFDEPPAFLFVSGGGHSGDETIYIQGQKVQHWTDLQLNAGVDDVTTYKIGYIAVKSRENEVKREGV